MRSHDNIWPLTLKKIIIPIKYTHEWLQDTHEYSNISGFLGFIYKNYAQLDQLRSHSEIILFVTEQIIIPWHYTIPVQHTGSLIGYYEPGTSDWIWKV